MFGSDLRCASYQQIDALCPEASHQEYSIRGAEGAGAETRWLCCEMYRNLPFSPVSCPAIERTPIVCEIIVMCRY